MEHICIKNILQFSVELSKHIIVREKKIGSVTLFPLFFSICDISTVLN